MTLSAALDPASQQNLTRPELLHDYKGKKGYFVKVFFAATYFNQNDWTVTDYAQQKDLKTGLDKSRFFGKAAPIIMREDFGHPPDNISEPEMLRQGEASRVGEWIDAGVDAETGNSWFVAEVTSKQAQDYIDSENIVYISPSLRSTSEFHTADGRTIVNGFRVNHAAIVKDPAFGGVAQIKAKCEGDVEHCMKMFKNVQASTKPDMMLASCGITGDTVIHLSADSCVSKWIRELSDKHPDWKQDQVVAVAYSKCGEEKQSNSESLKGNHSKGQSMPDKNFDDMTDEEKREMQKNAALYLASKQAGNNNQAEVESLKQTLQASQDEIKNLKASLETEVKTPIVESIVQAKIDSGLLEAKDKQASADNLMKMPLESLKTMQADVTAFKNKIASSQNSPTQQPEIAVRYSYQASKEDDEKPGSSVVASIRKRMSA